MDESGVERDGRRARRVANRQAAVEALVELYREGNLSPTAAEIAERAGLSARSLFRYFDDYDDLSAAAVQLQMTLAQPLLRVEAQPSDPTPTKVKRLVASRARQFEALAPAARAARAAASRRPTVAAGLTEARAFRRDQIRRLFEPELSGMSPARAARTLAAADVLCSFESYELLRHDQGLTKVRASATLVEAVTALLETGVSGGAGSSRRHGRSGST
jgi:AcrR family transcriptional regulator